MDLRIWQSLAEPKHAELIRVAAATNPKDVAAVERLRKITTSGEMIHAALQLAEARRKGAAKFGKRVATMWADPAGMEMATSLMVAEHKRGRVPVHLDGFAVTDMCCGIGGDAMALAVEQDVVAVDSDPVRAWMAGMNAGCRVVTGAAETYQPGPGPVHIDPARRDIQGKRSWSLADMSPGMDVVRRLVGSGWGGAVKLGPGVDLEEVARDFPNGKIEMISENGRLVQCVVWVDMPFVGKEARHATLLRREADEPSDVRAARTVTLSGSGREALPQMEGDRCARYVYEPDDSVERAGLLGVLCERVEAAMLHPRVGLLTSDARIGSPWLTAFEVLEVMPWNERAVKSALGVRGAGIVEVKTRGGVVDPDPVQKSLRGSGDAPLTVFVLRFDRALRAIIARRMGGA